VLHSLSSPRGILNTLPLGLAASYLRERIGSVRAPIAFHSAHNAIVCALLLVG
jgi:membrane protease YdiL (CAAX protease family)